MSSILTNNSAMVALQTLKSINSDLSGIQREISTGKTVGSAKDNAAVWAISKVMESDVAGFEAISDSLALGQASLGVAQSAAEATTDLLQEIKGKIVNSQEANVDRGKIQTDIKALTDQINSIVGAAQFNGLNLINNDGLKTADKTSNILSSLDRAADGTVASGQISVDRTNLGANKASLGAGATQQLGGANGGSLAQASTGTAAAALTINALNGNATNNTDITGVGYSMTITATGTNFDAVKTAGATDILYVAQEGDTEKQIAEGLKAAFDVFKAEKGAHAVGLSMAVNASGRLEITASDYTATSTPTVQVNVQQAAAGAEHTRAGSLAALSGVDVSTEEGAKAALATVEGLIQTSIDTAAALGSSARRIDTQAEFVGKLTDMLTSGIGSLVDADMEKASAKLQALQTQQQLGVQALSIANQAPQSILSLFR